MKRLCASVVLFLLSFGSAHGALLINGHFGITVDLLNHRNGGAVSSGGYYGLRVDQPSPTGGGKEIHTFSFESDKTQHGIVGNSTVQMQFLYGSQGPNPFVNGHALILGSVIHNQSDETWGMAALFRMHRFTNDDASDPWNSSANITDNVLSDLFENGDSVNGISEGKIKDGLVGIDRIAFDFVDLLLTPISATQFNNGQPLALTEYPPVIGDPPPYPFNIVMGHRAPGDVPVGFGWFTEVIDGRDASPKDFLFEIHPEPRLIPNPEPQALAIWAVLGLTVGTLSWWRRRAS